jgi:hypothetical protein
VPVVTNSCAFTIAREAAGAVSTRHSLRPLLRIAPRPLYQERREIHASLGRGPRRDIAGTRPIVIAGLDPAIHHLTKPD